MRRFNPIIYKFIIKKLIPIIKGGIYIRRKVFIYSTNIELIEFIRKEFTKYVETNEKEKNRK